MSPKIPLRSHSRRVIFSSAGSRESQGQGAHLACLWSPWSDSHSWKRASKPALPKLECAFKLPGVT